MLASLNKEKYLTIRWNNILAYGIGLPTLVFVVAALATSAFSDRTAFIIFAIMGAFY